MSRVWFEVQLCNKCVHVHERVCINASTAYQQIHTNKSQEFRIIPCYVILSTLYPPHPKSFSFWCRRITFPIWGRGIFILFSFFLLSLSVLVPKVIGSPKIYDAIVFRFSRWREVWLPHVTGNLIRFSLTIFCIYLPCLGLFFFLLLYSTPHI